MQILQQHASIDGTSSPQHVERAGWTGRRRPLVRSARGLAAVAITVFVLGVSASAAYAGSTYYLGSGSPSFTCGDILRSENLFDTNGYGYVTNGHKLGQTGNFMRTCDSGYNIYLAYIQSFYPNSGTDYPGTFASVSHPGAGVLVGLNFSRIYVFSGCGASADLGATGRCEYNW